MLFLIIAPLKCALQPHPRFSSQNQILCKWITRRLLKLNRFHSQKCILNSLTECDSGKEIIIGDYSGALFRLCPVREKKLYMQVLEDENFCRRQYPAISVLIPGLEGSIPFLDRTDVVNPIRNALLYENGGHTMTNKHF